MKHIPYRDTQNFHSIYTNIRKQCDYELKPYPVMDFHGSVKVHGTNAAIVISPAGDMYPQSRSRIVSISDDNAGFAAFVSRNNQQFLSIAETVYGRLKDKGIDVDGKYIAIYGEWAGKGIQKGVAVSDADRFFMLFDVKVCPEDPTPENPCVWANWAIDDIRHDDARIYNDGEFTIYPVSLDFSQPYSLLQDILEEKVIRVENQCPVGKFFGIDGIGEGIVFRKGDHVFKVKGERHAKAHREPKEHDPKKRERITEMQNFAESIVPAWRLAQGIDAIGGASAENIGAFIQWVTTDTLKEEESKIIESGHDVKAIKGVIARVAAMHIKREIGIAA